MEPLVVIEGGKPVAAISGDEDAAKIAAFHRQYYKPNSTFQLIFGGVGAGTVTVKSSNPKADCGPLMADVAYVSGKAKLKGNVMALATNAPAEKKESGLRRLPTAAERSDVEALVRAEMLGQKVSAAAIKTLKYQNLTAVDADGDGTAELVGSYWADTSPTSRALLFFIADKNDAGKYSFGYSEFQDLKKGDIMSGDVKDVDAGIYHERLLDLFDYDNDGVAEIFTYSQSFEGAGFNIYRREDGKWVKAFEGSNYHSAY